MTNYGWGLPPGVTERDIDEAYYGVGYYYLVCPVCGEVYETRYYNGFCACDCGYEFTKRDYDEAERGL